MFPEAFEKRMKHMLSDQWSDFSSAHQVAPPVSIRVNRRKSKNVFLEQIPWSETGKYLSTRPVFTLDPAFHAGAYYVQEASSMFLEQAFNKHIRAAKPLRILDLCAAPGGKSTHLLNLVNDESLLVSNEVIRSRVNVLTENIQKSGYPNCVITNNDAKDFQSLPGFFDAVIVDAPCSGEGLFRKDPSAMHEWSERNVEMCSARQKRILEDVWPSLKQEGILVYSTCTYNELENESNLRWLEQRYDIEFLNIRFPDDWGVQETVSGNIRGYRFFPHKVKGEGFFLAVIRKLNKENEVSIRQGKTSFSNPSKKITEEIEKWLLPGEEKMIQRDDVIQLLPALHFQAIHFLTLKLRVFYSGTFLAVQKHDKLIPEHALAMSTLLNRNSFFNVELKESEALRFLKKESLVLDVPHKGYALATWKGLALGWMNVLPGRINNLYPAEWRIRMK